MSGFDGRGALGLDDAIHALEELLDEELDGARNDDGDGRRDFPDVFVTLHNLFDSRRRKTRVEFLPLLAVAVGGHVVVVAAVEIGMRRIFRAAPTFIPSPLNTPAKTFSRNIKTHFKFN